MSTYMDIARSAAKKQTEQIELCRQLLSPSPVRLHHVPKWMRLALIRKFGRRGHELLSCVVTSSWLDHWGSSKWDQESIFVTEPYQLSRKDILAIDELCLAIGAMWQLSSNSWWYPGSTLRVVIREGPKE